MTKIGDLPAIIVLGLTVIAFGGKVFLLEKENERLKHEVMIVNQRSAIADEEIADLSSQRTYEDGFRDAMSHKDDAGYVEGYHRAIGQNQEHIQYLQAQLDTYRKQSNTQIAKQGNAE